MYRQQYPDAQYPHGPEMSSMHGQVPVDPTGASARYPFMPYYGPKGAENAQFAAAMSQRPSAYGGDYSSMGTPEAMYGQAWGNSMMAAGHGYMGPHGGKPGSYMQGMGGYPGAAPGYPGPPHSYPPSAGQYPPYAGSSHMPPGAHPSLMQQHMSAAGRHRFTPPTAEGGSSSGARPDSVEGAPYQGGAIPGGVLPPGGGSGNPAGWQSQGVPHGGTGGGSKSYGGDQSSPAPGGGGRAWQGPPYQSPEYPTGGSATPSNSQGMANSPSSNSSKSKSKEKSTPKGGGVASQPLLSPQNSELPKSSSLSSLRDHLLAGSTASTSSSQQQYASYSSPRMGGGDQQHQASPMTPSTNLPMTPESSSVLSPRVSGAPSAGAAARQDSQLSSSSQSMDQDSYSRQNSSLGTGGVKGGVSTPPHVDRMLSIQDDHSVDRAQQSSSPTVANSLRPGSKSGSSNLNSPHTTQSPLNSGGGGGGMLTPPNVVVSGIQDGRSPAPGRPELLGFPARSPSFHSENQPSPLTEDAKIARTLTMSPVDRNHPSISSQYDGDQKRKDFLDSLFGYLEKEGIQLVRLPMVCKTPFDLYQIFNSVQQFGGFSNVTEKRLWRDVIKTAYGNTSGLTSSSLRTVQQYYAKLLLPYECHLNNTDISTCLLKLDNSISRHTSLSSPCSQVSSDGELAKERVNHLSDVSKFDKGSVNSVEGRVNGEAMDSVSGPGLLDGEHLVKRVSSQSQQQQQHQAGNLRDGGGGGGGGGNGFHLSNNSGGGMVDSPSVPQRGVSSSSTQDKGSHLSNSQNHEDDQLGFEDSDTYAAQAALAEPLPEMSVQDAESVLGMSPMPYMAPQDGPSTPSGGVPSPSSFPSGHYQQQQQQQHGPGATPTVHGPMTPGSVGTPTGPSGGRGTGGGGGGGNQEYNSGSSMEVNEMGGASTPGISNASATPPAYPPPYPAAMDMSGYHPGSYSSSGYPPYNSSSFHRQYDMPPDFPPNMSSSMMRLPFPPGRGPYTAGMPPHRTAMDYHSHAYHPHMMHGGMRDPSMYPGGGMHGMSPPDWHWQQQQQQIQQQQHIQRLRQQQAMNAMRQQAALAAMQQSSSRNSPNLPPSHSGVGGSPAMEPGGGGGGKGLGGSQWQDQNHPHKAMLAAKMNERLLSSSSSTSSSPKPMPSKHHEPMPLDKAALSKMHHHHPHPHHEPTSASQSPAEPHKRSHPDWSNCVEGTKPMLVKRRKLYGFNCGHVEPWRLMMSLKSGILADSTWALDTLTILLHDESTYGYFNLKHHHSLLDTIVSHFKVILTAIFDIQFDDTKKYISSSSSESSMGETEEKEGAGGGGSEDANPMEPIWDACQTDFDVLKERNGTTQPAGSESNPMGLSVPVANVYSSEDMKLGKSDDLSHISIPSMEDEFFPHNELDLNVMSEEERSRLDQDSLLQRIDQTPISVLMKREALLSQIPLHRFGRLSHSPRRRERNFFGDMRKRESLSIEEGEEKKNPVTTTPSVTAGVKLEHEGKAESEKKKEAECEKKGETESEKKGEDTSTPSSSTAPSDANSTSTPAAVATVEKSKSEETASAPAASVAASSENSVGNSSTTRGESLSCPDPFPSKARKSTTSSISSPGKKDSIPSPILREESEVYRKEDLPLWAISPAREQLESRCKCISNILRSLTFVPGNDVEFCQHPGILIVLGKLLMLHHHHLLHSKDKKRLVTPSTSQSPSDDSGSVSQDEQSGAESCFDTRKVDDHHFPPAVDHWWWECLDVLREDTFVILANISGQLDLSIFPENVSFPIINGLLHWLVCPSSVACDPLPDSSKAYSQSPQRLVVEALAKMTISEVNVDLILATPPLMRLDLLFSQLGQMIGQKKHPVVQQFALVLLSNLAQGNECSSRLIGQQKMVMSLLLECLEMAERMACMGQGSMEGYGKDDPMSLSVAMLRRAASTLHYLSRVPANRTAFLPYRDRILYLSTSQYVEPSVSSILMDMLFEFGKL